MAEEEEGGGESMELRHKGLSELPNIDGLTKLSRLDLSFNKLTSVTALRFCSNLKWLSVAHNKLESLLGVEALSKLSVLNAADNALASVDQVASLTALRALILNDNRIADIPSLHRLAHLNTLVVSKNPITRIGQSLAKSSSITKLSMSHCRIGSIDASLKACVALKELRLSHNCIKALPAELAHNATLLSLDVGHNVITTWSDLKVLPSFLHLRNLNLHGNPIASNPKLLKKVKKMLPNLRVFNAKPINQFAKGGEKEKKEDGDENDAEPKKTSQENTSGGFDAVSKQKGQENKEKRKDVSQDEDKTKAGNKKLRGERNQVDVIDDGDVPFEELIGGYIKTMNEEAVPADHSKKKEKKIKKTQSKESLPLGAGVGFEVGMGGESTWGDDE